MPIDPDFYTAPAYTVCLNPVEPLPATSGFPLNYARIGYNNILFGASFSATSDNNGSARIANPATYDRWRPILDPSVATLIATTFSCDYVGIEEHNLGTVGANLKVEVSNGGGTTIVYDAIPLNDNALFIRFTAADLSTLIITVSGVINAEIGVAYMGLELEMMRPVYGGHTPIVLSANDKMTPQMSDGGQFLGKQIVRQGYSTSTAFKHLEGDWYREKFQPFVVHAKTLPYFWAWNLAEHPNDVVYGWTNENIKPTLMGIRNWQEVTFEIEAHA